MAGKVTRMLLVVVAALTLAVGALITSGGVEPVEVVAGFSVELDSGLEGSDRQRNSR